MLHDILHFALPLAVFYFVGAKYFKISDNTIKLLVGVHYELFVTAHGASTRGGCHLLSIVKARLAVNVSTAHAQPGRGLDLLDDISYTP